MRSAAAVRVAGSADDSGDNIISIHIAILVIYIPKELVREVAREQSHVHRAWARFLMPELT